MTAVDVFVPGVPCTSNNRETRDVWKAKIVDCTEGFQPVAVACRLKVEFRLAAESYATAPPFGSDLDNLLRPLLNALETTVLAAGDECIVELVASKTRAENDDEAGAHLRVEALPEEAT